MSIWYNISHIGVKDYDSVHKVRQKKMNNQVTFFTGLAMAFFIPYLIAVKNYYYIPYEVATVMLIAFAFVFNYFGLLKISMFWRFGIVIADVTFAALEMPGAGFEYFLIPLGLIPFILSNDTKTQIGLLLTAMFFFYLRMFISENYIPHSALTHKEALETYILVLAMVFVLCALFVIKFKKASVKYEDLVHEQLAIIEEKNSDITASIRYAKRIQNSLLPTEAYIERVLTELEKKEKEEREVKT